MRYRSMLVSLLLVLVTLGPAAAVRAQATGPRVIEITATSFKFEPNEIRVTEGERVIIRLRNADTAGRPHKIASRYFMDIPLTVRGDGRQGRELEPDHARPQYILTEPGVGYRLRAAA